MAGAIVGVVLAALIILGGLFSALRYLVLFLADQLRGHPGQAWFNRPYLFRAIAFTATLFWLYGTNFEATALRFDTSEQRVASFALYLLAATCFLWTLRISFLNAIPAEVRAVRTRGSGLTGWGTLAGTAFFVQVLCAAGVGALFAFLPANLPWYSVVLSRLGVFILFIISALASLWRTSYLAGPAHHTLSQRWEHVIGTHDADPLPGAASVAGADVAPAATVETSPTASDPAVPEASEPLPGGAA
jgi:hypothetical protein